MGIRYCKSCSLLIISGWDRALVMNKLTSVLNQKHAWHAQHQQGRAVRAWSVQATRPPTNEGRKPTFTNICSISLTFILQRTWFLTEFWCSKLSLCFVSICFCSFLWESMNSDVVAKLVSGPRWGVGVGGSVLWLQREIKWASSASNKLAC